LIEKGFHQEMQSVKFIKDVDEGTFHCLMSKEE